MKSLAFVVASSMVLPAAGVAQPVIATAATAEAQDTEENADAELLGVTLDNPRPTYGDTITAKVNPENADVTYQWYNSDGKIEGATDKSYTLTPDDVMKHVRVYVKSKGEKKRTVTVRTSAPVQRADFEGVQLSIPRPVVGDTIEALVESPVEDAELTYQWYNTDGKIEGATESTYTATDADIMKHLRVYVKANGCYTSTMRTAAPVQRAKLTSVELDNTTPAVGDTITASVEPEGADVTYQWYNSDGKIEGATDSSYKLTNADEGKYVRVYVKGSGKYTGTVTARTTAPAEAEDLTPSLKKADYVTEGLVKDIVVYEGKAYDLVSEEFVPGITVNEDGTMSGSFSNPSWYLNFTLEVIMDYDETSNKGVFGTMVFRNKNGFKTNEDGTTTETTKYEECDNVFKLGELGSNSNVACVTVPWVADSWNSGYNIRIPVQYRAHYSRSNYEYLPVDGDQFWSFSMDSAHGVLHGKIDGGEASMNMKTYTDENGDTQFVSRTLPQTLKLKGAHQVKEIRVYDRALTEEEQDKNYEAADIEIPTNAVSYIANGLTDLGSSFAFTQKSGEYPTMIETEKEAGTYTVTGESGMSSTYTIKDYVAPDNGIDNSGYESVHIANKLDELRTDKQYSLTAYPYPYTIGDGTANSASLYDVEWTSSDSSVCTIIDGLLIPKKAGTVTITATLTGTDMSDSFELNIVDPEVQEDIVFNVPEDYTSSNGDSFSDTDYEMTTRAIFAAITEASENGYNHIVFPQMEFKAAPIYDSSGIYAYRYNVPSNMTIEFPEGSSFHMMDNEISRGDGHLIELHYFNFVDCENSHLIIDKYYGERWETTHSEKEYLEELRFVNFGARAVDCSVEIHDAYKPAGYFIVADGTSQTNKKTGVMKYGDFVNGWLDENGNLVENENWISTENFITVPDYKSGGYFISADGQDKYDGKYWRGCAARMYDILWYDADQNLISSDRFQANCEFYDIPEDAAYFKVSLQQTYLPTPGENETEDSPWLAMHEDGAARFCEIKNTKVYNSATGVFSVVGETDGLWIHDCYTNRNGMKQYDERTGDFENGWIMMRHSIMSNNFFNGYMGGPGGYNTVYHTNFFTNMACYGGGECTQTRFINNVIDYLDVSEKEICHVYNNTMYGIGVDRFTTSLGHVLKSGNSTGNWPRSW